VPERGGTPAGPAHATKAALPPIPLPRPGQRPAGHAPSTKPELLPGWLGEVCPAPGLPGRTEDGKRLTCTRDGDQLRWWF
jgi:hypothetical protein